MYQILEKDKQMEAHRKEKIRLEEKERKIREEGIREDERRIQEEEEAYQEHMHRCMVLLDQKKDDRQFREEWLLEYRRKKADGNPKASTHFSANRSACMSPEKRRTDCDPPSRASPIRRSTPGVF